MRGADKAPLYKVVAVGESGVGKTALLVRYAEDRFSPSFTSTIGIDMQVRDVLLDGKRSRLQMWDTAGQERFRTITLAFYRGAHAVLVVFNVCDRGSFDRVGDWMRTCREHCMPSAHIMLVGTQSDRSAEREVDNASMAACVEEMGFASWHVVSAATGDGVQALFEEVVRSARALQSPEVESLRLTEPVNSASENAQGRKNGCCA